MSEEKDQMEDQPYPAQPYPAQPYPAELNPALLYPAQGNPSPSDFSANQNASNPPAYDAPSYPPPEDSYGIPQDKYDRPETPSPGYVIDQTQLTITTVTVVNVREEKSNLQNPDNMFSFYGKSVRLGFIKKVYAILAVQMAITVAISCLFMFHTPIKDFVQNNIGVYVAAYFLFFALYSTLVLRTSVARSYPCNMILLGIFTVSLAYIVAAITSFHDTNIVLMAFGITLVVCTAVMLFACQTKYDFTTCGGLLFVLTLCLLLFGIFAGIFVPLGCINIIPMVCAGIGALLFMGFLAFDTQLIMGGKKHEINSEDYVFAAMMLYADVVYIVLLFLSLFGGEEED